MNYGRTAHPDKTPASYKISEDLRVGERLDFRSTPKGAVSESNDRCGKLELAVRGGDAGLGWKKQSCYSLDPLPGKVSGQNVGKITCVGCFAEKRVAYKANGRYESCIADGPSDP